MSLRPLHSPTLRGKLLLANAAALGAILVFAAVSLWGLRSQREHVEASLAEYTALQLVESAELKVVAAKAALRETAPGPAGTQFKAALDDLRKYKAVVSNYDTLLPPEISAEDRAAVKAKAKSAAANLAALVAMFRTGGGGAIGADPRPISAAADALAIELADLMHICNSFQNLTEVASQRDLRRSTFAVALLAVAIPALALLLSFWQYRRIIVPLDHLRRWSRQIGGGDFSRPCRAGGDREFRELGEDFNRMAAELNDFYQKLEEMVGAKSKELVRSERLASVGYLAAGVAHEINTPLNIMSGYAELAVKRLRRSLEPDVVEEVIASLGVIRDEGFRCKEITRKLLSLAKGGGEGREAVSMMRVASEVAVMVRGLDQFHGRRLNVAIDPAEQLLVEANAAQMKQVLLNLMVNALESVRPGAGEVTVEGRRRGEWVEVSVIDNGRGMNRETLDRVFEPFYTNKRGAGEPGVGLGLSIMHAIVGDHAGRIHADSDGPGRGSRFTIRLPAREAGKASVETGSRATPLQEQPT